MQEVKFEEIEETRTNLPMMADTMLVVEQPTQDEEVYNEYADRTEKKKT